jgi:multicomponent Na+:H+ antiporter subunit B
MITLGQDVILASDIINVIMLVLMLATALSLIFLRNLFAVIMMSGIFSLTAAALYVVWDSVDVSFTEASVGAGISTVLMLATLALTAPEEKPGRHHHWTSLLVVIVTGALLGYATIDMPKYGDPEAPINKHVAPRYIYDSGREVGPPNMVTSTLAAYRGYDTLGETTVIFTAAAGVITIIGASRRRRRTAADVSREREV